MTFTQTDLLGVYTATAVRPDGSSSASSSPSASAEATAAPSGSPAARPADPDAPLRFAVVLFDVEESRIAPGAVTVLEGLGRAAPAPGT